MNSNAAVSINTELDLDPIKVKLMHKESGEGWSLEQVTAVEFEYRRFLCLIRLFPHEQVAPRFDVDIFWHYHILDTMKYAADCEQFFGYFLHHFPYNGLQGEDGESDHHRTGARMQELYEATFGEPYLRRQGIHAVAAVSQAAPTSTAWCVPTTVNSASLQGESARTSWCVPTTANQASLGALAKTAWCVPTTVNAASLQGASANAAWCVPVTVNPAWYRPASSKTAWCVPVAGNQAWQQGAKAITVLPRAVAPNDSFYARPMLAKAA